MEIVIGIFQTVIGGVIVAIVIFYANEDIFYVHNLTGEWRCQTVTIQSAYNPYRSMTLFYEFHFIQSGQKIEGSSEKIGERLYGGRIKNYPHRRRVLGKVSGYYQRNIFSNDVVFLQIVEKGQKRLSTTTFKVILKNNVFLKGKFNSTAASSSGSVEFFRR